jgi:hypothetical protein
MFSNPSRHALCLGLVLASTLTLFSQDFLTNQSIAALIKAHVKDEVIIEIIEKSSVKFDLTPQATASLKNQGASNLLILAMFAATPNAHPTESQEASLGLPKGGTSLAIIKVPTETGWQYRDAEDPITKNRSFYVEEDIPEKGASPPASFYIKGTCDNTGVYVKIQYLTATRAENPGFLNASIRNPIIVRERLDDEVRTARSLATNYINELVFPFQFESSGSFQDNPFGAIAKAFYGSLAGTPTQLFHANLIKLELPLADGSTPILELQPQDPKFQKFASKCQSTYPTLTGHSPAPAANISSLPRGTFLPGARPAPQQPGSPNVNAPTASVPVRADAPASSTNKPQGNLAVLTVNSTFQQPNPLAGTNFYLMRDDFATTMSKNGYHVTPGADPKTVFLRACGRPGQRQTCDQMFEASKANPAASQRSDFHGTAVMGPVQPGDYYLLIYSYGPGRPALYWDEKVTLAAGSNSFTAGTENSKPLR